MPTPEVLIDNSVVIHLKKHHKPESLPIHSKNREIEAQNNEQLSLWPGDEGLIRSYCLVLIIIRDLI